MDEQLLVELENSKKCLLETYELAAVYGALPNDDTISELVESYCTIKHAAERKAAALQKFKEAETVEEFNTFYENELKKLKPFVVKKSKDYRDFAESLRKIREELAKVSETRLDQVPAIDGSVENVDFMMSEVDRHYDPMTKQRIKNPMRNYICGHVYEKEVIKAYIRDNQRVRCPVAGCVNREYMDLSNLVEDHKLRSSLMKANEEELVGEEEEYEEFFEDITDNIEETDDEA